MNGKADGREDERTDGRSNRDDRTDERTGIQTAGSIYREKLPPNDGESVGKPSNCSINIDVEGCYVAAVAAADPEADEPMTDYSC